MSRTQICLLLFLSGFMLLFSGCGDKFFDPTQLGRFRPVPAVNVILDSLGVAEETPSAWEGAEDPKPVDVIVLEKDYTFGAGDVVRISIFELYMAGATFVNEYIVTETGKISIPDVGVVEATGLTETELEEQIKHILSPGILKEPSVTATLLSSQKYTYSILGQGVPAPGRYSIPRYDYRLNDALATARVATQFNVSYIYVSRALTGQETSYGSLETEVPERVIPLEPESEEHVIPQEPEVEELVIPEEEMFEIIAPSAHGIYPETGLLITSSEMVTEDELADMAVPDGLIDNSANSYKTAEPEPMLDEKPPVASRESIKEPINYNNAARIEWIFENGRWVPVQIGKPAVKEVTAKFEDKSMRDGLREQIPESFEWEEIETGGVQTRVVRIPSDKLAGGDPRYNIVIRPGDTIHVPVDVIGEFFIYGNTNSQGAVPLTGRPLTLKMAIAAAGGLGPLAWPKRCEVTRRIGKNKEETVMVDLDKIASGEQPDFFIKPLDLINVGTHPSSRWRAVLRNAFRATYGFGFVYDRNFSDRDFGTSRPIPSFISNLF